MNKTPTVLGIDPGVSTGICLAYSLRGEYRYTTATCTTPEEVWEFIDEGISVVVIERFDASLISRYGLTTHGTWWGVKALCWANNIEVVEDTPTQRKPYIPLAKHIVDSREHLTRHDLRHEIDATAHVVRYLYHEGWIKSLEVPS